MAGRVASKHIKRGAVVTQRGAAHVAAFIQSLQEHLQVQLFFAAGTSIQHGVLHMYLMHSSKYKLC